jgi:hypothetical protein
MTNIRLNIQYAYTSVAEEILMFKTFKGFKKQVVCETDNNVTNMTIARQRLAEHVPKGYVVNSGGTSLLGSKSPNTIQR